MEQVLILIETAQPRRSFKNRLEGAARSNKHLVSGIR